MTDSKRASTVLIVGAGPVGLVTALRLHGFGIRCTVFEADDHLPQDLRASTFHPPTMDMLEPYGITEQLLASGRPCPSWQIRIHETHEKAEFDLKLIADQTRHPYRLQCEQSKFCALLLEALSGSPFVDLRFGARVTAIEQDSSGVEFEVEERDRRRRWAGEFAVGADGARSVVRKALGLEFDGKTYPETTILTTTQFPFQDHLPGLSNVNYVWTEGGTFSLLHLPDRWRCSLYRDPDESVEDASQPDAVERKLQRIVPRSQRYEVLDQRVYRLHMRIVEDYVRGRVALAGDAAHLNSPSGGMGMNGGVHDAFVLTEELQRVLAGAPPSQLDRYTQRRLPTAKREILQQADRNRRRMQERDPAKRREMFEELQHIATTPELAREYLLRASMITGLQKEVP